MNLRPETYTALVTPFREDESIDFPALEALVEAQIQGGVSGLVPCGTTGESPTLSEEEVREVVRVTVKVANGRASVLAGTGLNSTKGTCARSRMVETLGVDGVMVVVPYYNRPSQDGLVEHFCKVAESVQTPVVLYNVPGRSAADLSVDSLLRIAERAPRVVGIKEATGNVLRAQEIARRCGDRMRIWCGDDALTLPMMAVGAEGVISVTSNVFPKEVSNMVRAVVQRDHEAARTRHFRLLPVHEAMFMEPSPAPAKAVLAARGRMKEVVRGPLSGMTTAGRERLLRIVQAYEAT